MLHKKRRQNK